MEQTENEEPPEELKGFKDLLRDQIIPNVEKISAVIVVLGIVFKILEFRGYSELLGIGLSTLAVTYYLNAFIFIPKDKNLIKQVLVKGGFVAGSVTLVGIMFALLKLPGDEAMLVIGLIALSVSLSIAAYQMLNSELSLYKQLLIKLGVVFALGLIVFVQ